ncbi:MAG: hypothetical protein J6Y08_10670 [Clostridiales bacterium]|nr:hypothetical protein [Clostridiales bacterium]
MSKKEPKRDASSENVSEPKKDAILPDPSIEAMTREEAMAYFDLPVWAKPEDLDKQFWKLGKIYKAQKDEQKLADLAAAYNIANGTRDRKLAEKKEEETSRHILGKTSKQWKEFWHYEWWKFLIAIAAVVFIVAVIKVYFMSPKVDLRVASIGHFSQDTEILSDYLKSNTKFKNPDIGSANVVSDNEEGEEVDPYATQLAVSLMAVKPDLLVYDALTAPVYVNSENLAELDDLYETMKATWSEEELSHIEPFIYSRAQFYEDYSEMLYELYEDELEPLTDKDYEEHVYGFIIRDRVDCLSLGYTVQWEGDASIIVGVNVGSGQLDAAKKLADQLLKDIPTLRAAYIESHPYVEAED